MPAIRCARAVARILLERAVDLLLRLLQVALAQVLDAELQVDLGRALWLRLAHVVLLLAQPPRQMPEPEPIATIVAARFTVAPPLR